MAGFGRRFALEAAFLVALAVGAGVAELSAGRIVGLMALGWAVAMLFELVAWRLSARRPHAMRGLPDAVVAEPPSPPKPAPEPEAKPEEGPRPGVSLGVNGEEAAVEEPSAGDEASEAGEKPPTEDPAAGEPPTVGATAQEPPTEGAPTEEAPTVGAPPDGPRPQLEPLLPRPRRRPFWRRRASGEEPAASAPSARPSARHVRLLPRGRGSTEGERLDDVAEREG
ncbi:MAG: hypothetical protein ABR583_04010 [Gaiellaceae bacterium]